MILIHYLTYSCAGLIKLDFHGILTHYGFFLGA